MASNCMIHGRNCADTVPSNIGTFGLDDGRDAELFIPLLLLVGECWMSPLFPCSSSCVGRWLRSCPPLPRAGSVGAVWLKGDSRRHDGRAHLGRTWCREGACRCGMRGIAPFDKTRQSLLDLFNAIVLLTVTSGVVLRNIVHIRVDLFRGYLYGAHSLRQFLEFHFPALNDFM